RPLPGRGPADAPGGAARAQDHGGLPPPRRPRLARRGVRRGADVPLARRPPVGRRAHGLRAGRRAAGAGGGAAPGPRARAPARPEVHEVFPRLWAGHKVQEIALRGLSRRACERLIREVLGKDVPGAAVDRAIEQSAGNALFLEEMIRAIAEGKAEEQPETVVAMLQARIGRLPAGPRRTLEAASVFGQTFWDG